MKKLIWLLAALSLATPIYALSATNAEAAKVMSEGVVRKIDPDSNKITLKHGPIVNLDMPGMTMVFRVVSPTLMSDIKVGDAVKFHVEKLNGSLTITDMKLVK